MGRVSNPIASRMPPFSHSIRPFLQVHHRMRPVYEGAWSLRSLPFTFRSLYLGRTIASKNVFCVYFEVVQTTFKDPLQLLFFSCFFSNKIRSDRWTSGGSRGASSLKYGYENDWDSFVILSVQLMFSIFLHIHISKASILFLFFLLLLSYIKRFWNRTEIFKIPPSVYTRPTATNEFGSGEKWQTHFTLILTL